MIKELQLENFKCFEKESIQLAELNLLAGLNGMGKSTVIQSLLLLRQNYENGLLHLQHKLGLNGEYTEIGNSSDLLYKFFDKKEIGIGIKTSQRRKYSWRWDAKNASDIIDEITGSFAGLEKLPLFSTNFHYLSAERVGPRPFYKTSTAKVVHQNQLGVNGEFAANYFVQNQSIKIPIPGLRRDNTIGLTLYEQLNSWLGVIRPGTRVNVIQEPNSGIVSLNFQFPFGQDAPVDYKAPNVGFGLTYIFPVLTAILASKPKTLLLLENPEAHIHPAGQAEFGILLAKAAAGGIQVIVETHSDHILNGIRLGVKSKILEPDQCNLLYFSGKGINDRYKHFIDYIKVNSSGKLSRRPEGFFDVWENMLIKLV